MVRMFREVVLAVVALAVRQKGVVARCQVLDLGMSSPGVSGWIEQGRLHPVHPGVYLVGHPIPAPLAMEQAALLACGLDSFLSHHTAAWLFGFLPDYDGPVHVTTPRHRGRPRRVKVHTSRRLERRDTTRRHSLPITTPARTLLDLAEQLDGLERTVEAAFALRRVTERQLRDVVKRHPGRRGAKNLTALLDYRGDTGFSRSAAEDRLRHLLRIARLPQPLTNQKVHGHEVDFYWPEHRLIVEVDSWTHHADRHSFENDRAKRADLQARGYVVLPVTARQLMEEPEATIARIAAPLALASAA